MCIDVMNAAVGADLVDHCNVAIGIVDEGARPDALRRDRHGIVVRQHPICLTRWVPVMRRRDRVDHARDRAASVHDGANNMMTRNHAVTESRVAYVPSRADRQDGRRIRKRQSILPSKISAQHVGQIGTISIESHARWVRGVEHGIGCGARQTGMHVAATAFADPCNEILKRRLIGLAPARLGDTPMPCCRSSARNLDKRLVGRPLLSERRRSCRRPLICL